MTIDVNVKDLKPGDEVEFSGFLMVAPYGYLTIHSAEMPEYITLGPIHVTVTIPDGFNGIHEMVKVLDKKADEIRGKAAEEIAVLTKKKNDLLQLSYGGNDILDPEND